MIAVDMDMPENCFTCRFSFAFNCQVTGHPISIPNSNCVLKRPQWCPLKEVSNYGEPQTATRTEPVWNRPEST